MGMNKQEFRKVLSELGIQISNYRIRRAYWLAKKVHDSQKRDNGERYFEHCRRVALFVAQHGGGEDEVIIALLHDCIEDGFIPQDILMDLFGQYVASSVETLSKVTQVYDSLADSITKSKKSPAEYYAAIGAASDNVKLIKLADRIDNIRDMHSWKQERKQRYIRETEKFLLPMARSFSPDLAQIIEEECRKLPDPWLYSAHCCKCSKEVGLFKFWTVNAFLEFESSDRDLDRYEKYRLSAPVHDVTELLAVLEKENWKAVMPLATGFSYKFFCYKGNHFYCHKCARHFMGGGVLFSTKCPLYCETKTA